MGEGSETPEEVTKSLRMALTESNFVEAAFWVGGRISEEKDALDPKKITHSLLVPTRNGVERAYAGDVIVLDPGTTAFFHIHHGVNLPKTD